MDRRKFLIGIGGASLGGSALLGTGAFSRVESQRGVSIQVAEDPYAYLGLAKCGYPDEETPNSSYAHLDEKGHLEIRMDPENPTIDTSPLGSGVNSDSRTWFDNVFQICNQGKEDVCVYILDDPDWPWYDVDERRVNFYPEDDRDGSIVGVLNQVEIPLGECLCVGLSTTTKGLVEGDELLAEMGNEIVIVADVECDDPVNECAPCVPDNDFAGRLDEVTFENTSGSTRHIEVRQTGPGTNPTLFEGDVDPGETFLVEVILQRPPDIELFVDGSGPIQVVQDGITKNNFHVSCSATVEVGQRLHTDSSMVAYDIQVVSGVTRGGIDIC